MHIKTPKHTCELPFHKLFQEQNDALRNGARLLAGKRGERLVDDIVEALQHTAIPDRRTLRNLIALHRILALDLVDVPSSEEAARFSEIDAASPIVEDLCILKDSFDDALAEYAKNNAADLSAAAA